jgi:hypothetical protein
MNDRISAAPPMFFVGSAAADDEMDVSGHNHHHHHHHLRHHPFVAPTIKQQDPEPVLTKRGSRQFLGQVLETVREKFRIRREGDDDGRRRKKQSPPASNGDGTTTTTANNPMTAGGLSAGVVDGGGKGPGDRPTREEVFANYNELVASGFFSSHAIHSTRHQLNTNGAPQQPQQRPTLSPRPAPQWPLMPHAATVTPVRNTRANSNLHTPASAASAGSRGKKRPSISMDLSRDSGEMSRDADGENGDGGLRIRKLRKTASTINRDLSVPRARSASRGLRSFSNAARANGAPLPAVVVQGEQGQLKREPNKLVKRVPSRNPADGTETPPQATSPPVTTTHRYPTRRNVSESVRPRAAQPTITAVNNNNVIIHQPTTTDGGISISLSPAGRVLRPRRSANEPLRVRPDANHGIPIVPDIPVKFTYGEDRENGEPWKGLGRTHTLATLAHFLDSLDAYKGRERTFARQCWSRQDMAFVRDSFLSSSPFYDDFHDYLYIS